MVARLPQCFFKILFSLLRKVLGSPSIQKNLKKHYTKSSYHLAYFRWSKINEGLIRSGNSRFRIFTHTLVIWKYEHFSFLKWHSAQVLREIILIAKNCNFSKFPKLETQVSWTRSVTILWILFTSPSLQLALKVVNSLQLSVA